MRLAVRQEELDHSAESSGRSAGLVFGRSPDSPFDARSLARRASTAWRRLNAERAARELEPFAPLGLHEARHTFASLMIAAGVNVKALSSFMGHSSITLDRYGHLLPGSEEQAAALLDAYLRRARSSGWAAGQSWASEGHPQAVPSGLER